MGKNVQNWPFYLQQFFQKFLKNSSKTSMYLYIGPFSENIFIHNSLTIRGNCHSVFLPDLGGAVLVFAI